MDSKKKLVLLSVAQLNRIFFSLFNSTLFDSESDSSDDESEFTLLSILNYNVHPREREIPRCENYYEITVPRYLPEEFQSHFRMTPDAFHTLCRHIIPRLKTTDSKGRPIKNSEKQILAVIWLLATPDSYR